MSEHRAATGVVQQIETLVKKISINIVKLTKMKHELEITDPIDIILKLKEKDFDFDYLKRNLKRIIVPIESEGENIRKEKVWKCECGYYNNFINEDSFVGKTYQEVVSSTLYKWKTLDDIWEEKLSDAIEKGLNVIPEMSDLAKDGHLPLQLKTERDKLEKMSESTLEIDAQIVRMKALIKPLIADRLPWTEENEQVVRMFLRFNLLCGGCSEHRRDAKGNLLGTGEKMPQNPEIAFQYLTRFYDLSKNDQKIMVKKNEKGIIYKSPLGHLDIFICPYCKQQLNIEEDEYECRILRHAEVAPHATQKETKQENDNNHTGCGTPLWIILRESDKHVDSMDETTLRNRLKAFKLDSPSAPSSVLATRLKNAIKGHKSVVKKNVPHDGTEKDYLVISKDLYKS